MKFAPIVPTPWLHILEQHHYPIHMMLAQYAFKDKDYAAWYRFRRPADTHLIVDNGAAEGVDLMFEEVVEVAQYVGADEIVMPDVLRDTKATLRATLDEFTLNLVPPNYRMLVPQGDDWMSWTYCLSIFTDPQTVEARSIGVAKHLERLPGGRAKALQIISDRGVDKRYDIHLLGIWAQPFHEVRTARKVTKNIRSIDTAAPIAYAQHKQKITDMKHYSLDWNAELREHIAVSNLLSYGGFCAGYKETSSG